MGGVGRARAVAAAAWGVLSSRAGDSGGGGGTQLVRREPRVAIAVTSVPTPTPVSIIAVAVDMDVQDEPVRHSPLCTSKVPHPAGFRGGPPMLISVSHPVFAIATPFGSTPAIILARPS